MEQFWVVFWSILGTIGTGLATWLTTVIINWLNTKIRDKKMAQWASDASRIVLNAVQTVFQEFVDVMKKAGKWDEKAADEAKNRAYTIIVNELSPELRKYITENFGDMKTWILNHIESCIYELKKYFKI